MDKVSNKRELRKAVTDFIQFEDETSLIWPWAIPADRLLEDEELLQKIVETVRFDETGNYAADDLYDAIDKTIGNSSNL